MNLPLRVHYNCGDPNTFVMTNDLETLCYRLTINTPLISEQSLGLNDACVFMLYQRDMRRHEE